MTAGRPRILKEPEPKDGETVWWVPSRSHPERPRVVDLEYWNGNGACDCPDFKMNREKWLRRGAAPAIKYECKHIRWAKRAFAKLKLRQVMQARGTIGQRTDGP